MIYLASPYTHSDSLIMKTRFLLAEQVTARLIQQGRFVYSPIVHCHAMSERYALPTTFDFWKAYNFDMIRHASELYVLSIDGWEESKGVRGELEFARQFTLPIFYVDEEGYFLGPDN